VWFLNEQSHVTLLIRNFVGELTQFPDVLHGSTLKSQSVLLSLLAIPLSASTEKANAIQILPNAIWYAEKSARNLLPWKSKFIKKWYWSNKANMKHPQIRNIAHKS
jgi:hypothetical protein